MPKLWTETIDAHRAALRDAILDATAELIGELGLVALSMSQIADRAGIGRATLYKYFADVQAVVAAWHERQINSHLQELHEAANSSKSPTRRLEAVLRAYAQIQHKARGHHASELASALHHGTHVDQAAQQLRAFLRQLIIDGVAAGDIRTDITADELTEFCLHATAAAVDSANRQAVDRVVTLTMAAFAPDRR